MVFMEKSAARRQSTGHLKGEFTMGGGVKDSIRIQDISGVLGELAKWDGTQLATCVRRGE